MITFWSSRSMEFSPWLIKRILSWSRRNFVCSYRFILNSSNAFKWVVKRVNLFFVILWINCNMMKTYKKFLVNSKSPNLVIEKNILLENYFRRSNKCSGISIVRLETCLGCKILPNRRDLATCCMDCILDKIFRDNFWNIFNVWKDSFFRPLKEEITLNFPNVLSSLQKSRPPASKICPDCIAIVLPIRATIETRPSWIVDCLLCSLSRTTICLTRSIERFEIGCRCRSTRFANR